MGERSGDVKRGRWSRSEPGHRERLTAWRSTETDSISAAGPARLLVSTGVCVPCRHGGRGRCRMRGRQSMPGRGPEMPETPTFGRYAEIPYDQMTPEQQEGYRLLIETRGALGGPNKVWVHNPKLAKVMGPLGAYFRTGYSLSEREREIAVVIINSKWHSIYPTNAHERAGKAAGLPADKVEAMLSGLPTSFDNKREQVVYEMATCLANSRWVPKGLYDRAVEALGHAGITDVICLMGFYTSVSMTLAFYDVPAGATGMAR